MREAEERLLSKANELWEVVWQKDPYLLAQNTGSSLEKQLPNQCIYKLNFWQSPINIQLPGGQVFDDVKGEELDPFSNAILAYYFYTSNGMPIFNTWISFTDLPDGKFYTQAFQGYTGNELARKYGNDINTFSRAAVAVGGCEEDFADKAFSFLVLPRVKIAAAAWMGDEDFPSSYRILFDGACPHHLTTDGLAILGS